MKLKITLKKSLIARLPAHIVIANSLGLHKVGDCTEQPDNSATRGKIQKIIHLVKVD